MMLRRCPSRIALLLLIILYCVFWSTNLVYAYTKADRSLTTISMYSNRFDLLRQHSQRTEIEGTRPPQLQQYNQTGLCLVAYQLQQTGRSVIVMVYDNDPYRSHDSHIFRAVRGGWPFTVLEHETIAYGSERNIIWPEDRTPATSYRWRAMFLSPLIFAVPLWILLCMSRTASRALLVSKRKRKGLCAQCGYALDSLPRCPECGVQIA